MVEGQKQNMAIATYTLNGKMLICIRKNTREEVINMMHENKIKQLISMPTHERFEYFIRKVTDFEEVWSLKKDGWATLELHEKTGIPFWPEKELADLCISGEWEGFTAEKIPLTIFIEKWVIGMKKDNYFAMIFPIPDGKGCICYPDFLLDKIKNELSNHE